MSEINFLPVRGSEAMILNQQPIPGAFYVANDTGKMYMDVEDDSGTLIHKAIGGSGSALYYISNATPEIPEFPANTNIFSYSDLEEERARPQYGDLLINIALGTFLRVEEGNYEEDKLVCTVLAVSGSGGGGGEGGGGSTPSNGRATISYVNNQSQYTVLKGQPCMIKYVLTATDAAGDPILSSGTATWAVKNVVKATTTVYPGENEFDIAPYLSNTYGEFQEVSLKISINTGGETNSVARKTFQAMITDLSVDWNYNLTTINSSNEGFTIEWTPYGALDKTTHIIVDKAFPYEKKVGMVSGVRQSMFFEDGLAHGAHEISLYVEAMLNGEPKRTETITHELIFVDETLAQAAPVIVAGKVPAEMSQYDTIKIPLVAYDKSKVGSTVEVIFYEDDIEVERQQVDNGKQFDWNYTPSVEGYKKLSVACGTTKKSMSINVKKIDLGGTAEVTGYAFRLKASDFVGNNALKNWNSNGVTATFSEDFDWVNGGLKSEKDAAGNTRQYVNIKAGSYMTINYSPFANNVTTGRGKCIKVIFKATNCRDYDAEILKCFDPVSNRGIILGAQQGVFKSSGSTVNIPYCEDTYIELEVDVTRRKTDGSGYIMTWLDGVPSGLAVFKQADQFDQDQTIVIGSPDADVQIYMIKAYEDHIEDTGHLMNFIMDAPNSIEMINRFNRNDILDERNEISPTKLAQKNPNCRVHCYTIPRMTTSKDEKIKGCDYVQYHGSDSAVLSAKNVTTRVQGTSSAAYGLAAFNIDAKFEDGFDYPDGSWSKKWSMDEEAIPVNYFTTKVNVASCENANNALNQEFYNKYQPYVSPNKRRVRTDGKKARDCMQFYPGVLFIEDHNQETSFTGDEGVKNNVFKDTDGYLANPYPKLYAVCNMGNSKKNTEVFHDLENPLECCIEVADNQNDIQRMTRCVGLYTQDKEDIFVELTKLFEEDGSDVQIECSDGQIRTAYNLWREANMSKAAFEFRYPDGLAGEDESFETLYPDYAKQALVGWFNFVKWMADSNPAAATGEKLPEPKTFNSYTFKGDEFSSTFKGFTVSSFAGTYEYDTEKYRMAKMLSECEDHLVMDSVMYHFLFIERHTMIDNVAKNTFWSSGDAQHWDLTKNYDNDTADGNDNQGKLSLTYGLEPGDTIDGVPVFNAPGAVWLEFTRRLPEVAQHMHQVLETKEIGDPWDSNNYIKTFDEWQATIPERCWIEAYRRLYIRPYEVYGAGQFLEMLEGGKKTHQRRQYENYQNMYISSKYFGKDCEVARLSMRPNAEHLKQYKLPIEVYADCYIKAGVGKGTGVDSINYSARVKRGEILEFVSPTDSLTDATMYLYPGTFYQVVGDSESDNHIGAYNPDQLGFGGAKKLRKLVIGVYDGENTKINTGLTTLEFAGNTLLEELYAAGYQGTDAALDLTSCPNLKSVDARKSSFTTCSFASGAPIETIKLENPSGLTMTNLNKIETFMVEDYSKLQSLFIDNIDDCDGINSLMLVKEGVKNPVLDYYLKNVQWQETSNQYVSNDGITYLDTLLTRKPKDPVTSDVINHDAALTGVLTVAAAAYNDSDSNLIYDKYVKLTENHNSYPSLDIVFEGAEAYMPKVTIVNATGEATWTKRIKHNNTGITADFLASGPLGSFIPFESYSDSQYVYTFLGTWQVKAGNTVLGTIGSDSNPQNYPLWNEAIDEDIIIEPNFSTELKKFNLTFYNTDGSVIETGVYPYGTLVGTVVPVLTPRRDDSDLDDFYTYKFNGYTIGDNVNTVMSTEQLVLVELRDNMELTAHYEPSHVYLNPLDEGYFSCNDQGKIALQDNSTLSGKVVVPITVNGIVVTGLATGCFQDGFRERDTENITHVFFEPKEVIADDNGKVISYKENDNIVSLDGNCFYGMNKCKMIELPYSISQASETGSNSLNGLGLYITCQIILNPKMKVIPPHLFKGYNKGTLVMKADVENGTYSNTIKLPNLVSIGVNAFEGANISNLIFELPNVLKFGGNIGSNCEEIRFGESGTTINPKFSWIDLPVEEGTKIWGANMITLYDPSALGEDEAYKFLETYFNGAISHTN